jgi:hypothetical protein
MDRKDLEDFQSEIEALKNSTMLSSCTDEGCITDEGYEDYPDYLKAIYAEIMPPAKSGIYFSRWDLKTMASQLDESFAIDVRERMFQKFMQWIATPDDMLKVIDQFSSLMDMKCELYKEYAQKYPATKESFEKKIEKAEKAKKYFHKVYEEFFT